jgi:putative membrane protein
MMVFVFDVIAAVIIFVAFIYYFNEKDQRRSNLFSEPPQGDAALDIAKKRYARGEISKEEFERLRHDLQG